jgi:hypothetical protein
MYSRTQTQNPETGADPQAIVALLTDPAHILTWAPVFADTITGDDGAHLRSTAARPRQRRHHVHARHARRGTSRGRHNPPKRADRSGAADRAARPKRSSMPANTQSRRWSATAQAGQRTRSPLI